jgi:hypothetical protein
MILRTVEQVRRVFLIIAGFTLLSAGGVMLVTPGPGMLVIFLGLVCWPLNLFGRAASWSASSTKAGA